MAQIASFLMLWFHQALLPEAERAAFADDNMVKNADLADPGSLAQIIRCL